MLLIIDGDSFINVSLNVVRSIILHKTNIGQSAIYIDDILNNDEPMLTELAKLEFREFIIKYLTSIISPLNSNIKEVIFVSDSKSWRKSFLKNEVSAFIDYEVFDEVDSTYKLGRPSDVAKELFKEYFNSYILPKLKLANINFIQVDNTEGDDLIAYLCSKINTNIIIWSGDNDMKQLIETTPTRFIIQLMPKQVKGYKQVVTSIDFNETSLPKSTADDFFEVYLENYNNDNIITKLINKEYQHITLCPIKDLLTKILAGDTSDNIQRIYKLTPKKREVVLENILKTDNILYKINNIDETFISDLVNNIVTVCKIDTANSLLINNIKKHIILNIKVIRLHSNLLPDDLLGTLDELFSDMHILQLDYIKLSQIKKII